MEVHQRIFLAGMLCFSWLCAPGIVRADTEVGSGQIKHQPQTCIGFFDLQGSPVWGVPKDGVCPPQHAVYGALIMQSTRWTSSKKVGVIPVCCPLPAPDILTDEHHWVFEHCPANSVVTGSDVTCGGEFRGVDSFGEVCERRIRCTRVNTVRYQLGERTGGAIWGNSSNQWQESMHFLKASIPASIRYALGRYNRYYWGTNGCVGYPFGSLLVEKRGGLCRGQRFQSLEYQGLDGDPPQGTAVQMFAECDAISTYMNPQSRCIRYESAQ